MKTYQTDDVSLIKTLLYIFTHKRPGPTHSLIVNATESETKSFLNQKTCCYEILMIQQLVDTYILYCYLPNGAFQEQLYRIESQQNLSFERVKNIVVLKH